MSSQLDKYIVVGLVSLCLNGADRIYNIAKFMYA